MKTESISTGDPIWTNNVDLLPNEECLPIMGSCQVTSILQNLEPNQEPNLNLQNMEMIILNNDYKTHDSTTINVHNNYVVLKENGTSNDHCKPEKTFKNDNLEEVLYFVCNLCPFLCTRDSKITEHLETDHKNMYVTKLTNFKCPACRNVFYHKLSLMAHLIHDHKVSDSDLKLIIEAVMYYANKNSQIKEKKPNKIRVQDVVNLTEEQNIPEPKFSKKLPEKLLENDEDSNGADGFVEVEEEDEEEQKPKEKPNLPQIDLTQNSGEKIFNSLMQKPTSSTKYINAKKCYFPSCKVRLIDAEKLNYHLESHTEDGYSCLECQEKFLMWKPLASHLWRSHRIDMELFSCDSCDYKTYSLAKLNNVHKLIHGDAKSFKCTTCDKAFKNNKQLRNHKIIHREKSEKSSFACEICSKIFSDKRTLRSHLDIVHKKIKPFLCSYCGYKGSSRSALKMHTRLHTGEKPFACDHCAYTTSDHNSLRRHKLRHTGHKPYKCAYCSYACIQSSTYKVHLKTKHPGLERDLMFTCVHCQFRSVNKEMYVSHMFTEHKQKASC